MSFMTSAQRTLLQGVSRLGYANPFPIWIRIPRSPRRERRSRMGKRVGRFYVLYDLGAEDVAAGSFAVGVRQSISAGAGGTGAGGTGGRIHGRRSGVELPGGASGAARQCVADRGKAGAAGGTAWRPAAERRGRARAGVGAVRRRGAATAVPALLCEVLRGGFRQRAG